MLESAGDGGVGRHLIWNGQNVPDLDLRLKHRNTWGYGVPGSQNSKLAKAPTTRAQVPPNSHTQCPLLHVRAGRGPPLPQPEL